MLAGSWYLKFVSTVINYSFLNVQSDNVFSRRSLIDWRYCCIANAVDKKVLHVCCTFWFSFGLCRTILVHQSLKLLMDIHCIWILLLCLSTFANNLVTLSAHLTMRYAFLVFSGTNQGPFEYCFVSTRFRMQFESLKKGDRGTELKSLNRWFSELHPTSSSLLQFAQFVVLL